MAPPASPDEAISAQTLVRVDGVSKRFPIRSGALSRTIGEVRAVSEVSFDIRVGETLGLVGESGCGKSTLGQTLVGLYRPNEGAVRFDFGVGGTIDPANAKGAQRRQLRTDVRMVFQDPTASLNPRLSVRDIIGEVLEINGTMRRAEIDQRVEELLAQVGLDADYAGRYPHAFSGGQRQRVAIARALAPRPRLVIADEAVSALDVSVQTQIINLMKELQRQYGLTYLFISHDLSVIANISDRVAVMYAGRMVEMGETSAIFLRPQHPYTETLLAAVPGRNRRRTAPRPGVDVPIEGPVERVGCSFAGRCPYVQERCRRERPELAIQAGPQSVACHRARELSLASPVTG